jgi:hypothetical protein
MLDRPGLRPRARAGGGSECLRAPAKRAQRQRERDGEAVALMVQAGRYFRFRLMTAPPSAHAGAPLHASAHR